MNGATAVQEPRPFIFVSRYLNKVKPPEVGETGCRRHHKEGVSVAELRQRHGMQHVWPFVDYR